jgi:broad specificity phosphatase PhoE
MTRVVVIRPGATDYDEQGRIQGMLNVTLNAHGVEQAARIAEELRDIGIHTLYCGTGESPAATAELIGKALGVRVRKLDKLHNVNHGLWQGLQVEEVRHKHPKVYRQWCESPMTVCPPGGETIAAAFERVRRVLRPIIKRHADEVIGIVVPEPVASLVRCYIAQQDPARIWELRESDRPWQSVDLVPEEASRPVQH